MMTDFPRVHFGTHCPTLTCELRTEPQTRWSKPFKAATKHFIFMILIWTFPDGTLEFELRHGVKTVFVIGNMNFQLTVDSKKNCQSLFQRP